MVSTSGQFWKRISWSLNHVCGLKFGKTRLWALGYTVCCDCLQLSTLFRSASDTVSFQIPCNRLSTVGCCACCFSPSCMSWFSSSSPTGAFLDDSKPNLKTFSFLNNRPSCHVFSFHASVCLRLKSVCGLFVVCDKFWMVSILMCAGVCLCVGGRGHVVCVCARVHMYLCLE